jgi:hypothetical protein
MRKNNLLFGLLIGLLSFSCSSDDNNDDDDGGSNNPPDLTSIVYKKASSYENSNLTSFQEVFYNSDKQIEQVVTNIDNGWRITTIDITYSGADITGITKTTNFGSSNTNDIVEEYNVSYSNTQIKLIEANGIDYEIQIDFTGDYVDAIRTVQSSDMMIFSEDTFQRNSENNIISHSNSDFTFTYSNFDSGNVMPFNREYSFDYFIAFDLTPSEKLPLIENVNFTSGGSDTYTIDSSLLTYDNENNITLFGDNTNYIDFEYIEL